MLAALVALIFAAIWRAPEGMDYIGHRSGEILLTLAVAVGLTYLLRPLVNSLQKFAFFSGKTHEARHRGRALAVIFVFACLGLAIYLLILVGLQPITRDAMAWWNHFVPENPQERQLFFDRLRVSAGEAIAPYRAMLGPEITDKIQDKVPFIVDEGVAWARGKVGHLFHGAGIIVELLLIPVLVFYFLCDGPAIRAEGRLLVPEEWRPRLSRMTAHLDRVFDGYIRGQMLMCLIAWILVTLMLLALGVKYAFTLGIIAGLTRAVPVIGPLLGAIPLAVVCFVTTRSVPTTALLLLGFTLMHFLESKVLLPQIIGHEVDLHPVTVILALLIGMEFFGIMGVFLAVPIAAVLKIALAEWHEGRRLARVEAEAKVATPV
jgi:predicted PurR-regulated permease PerM